MSNDSSDRDTVAVLPDTPRTGTWIAPFALIGVVISFFASQLAAGLAIYAYAQQRGWSNTYFNDWITNSITAQFAYMVIGEVLLIGAIIGLMKLLRWTRRTIGLTKPQLKHLGLGVLAVAPYYALYVAIVIVVSHIFPSLNVNQKQEVGFDNVVGPVALILTFISLVIIPPLVEEIAMRGFMYTGLRQWLPKVAAAFGVSLVFGLAHLSEGGAAGPLWIGAIDTFTLSLVLVYLREKTGNLWSGIVLHACKNGIAFILLYILKVA